MKFSELKCTEKQWNKQR